MLKEKIEALSQGKFEYQPPLLCFSKEEISIEVVAGQVYEDSIRITNSINRRMKGLIYSSNRLLTLPSNSFVGKDKTITYIFNATFLKPGDEVEGELTIVSDCGEYQLPFLVKIIAPYAMTSIGKVEDLFQFTNLAKADWPEAMKLFRSEEFEKAILRDNSNYLTTYRKLLKSLSTSQALEEFLILTEKKKAINLNIDKRELKYDISSDDEIKDKLILRKNNWGYGEIRLSTDLPFIKLQQKRIWTDRFIGDDFQILFTIDPKNISKGKNYGKIYIKTFKETIEVKVFCHKKVHEEKEKQVLLRKKAKETDYKIVQSYLDFQLNKINSKTYSTRVSPFLTDMLVEEGSRIPELMEVHLALISDKRDKAAKILEEMSSKDIGLRRSSAFEYCAYLYLLALYAKDRETIDYATKTIKSYYLRASSDWRLLWFLLYIDKEYNSKVSLKLEHIRNQFNKGCTSPVIYYEAVSIYNKEPYLLRQLHDFEIQVMNYGIKNNILTKDAVNQYTYLAARMKSFHPLVFRALTILYETYKKEEILSSICSMLIKGLKGANKYFKWFKLGVESQLRITGLYEYYIYSIDENTKEPLDQAVLLYFIYNSNINNRKKEFLYANIIKNKSSHEEIYYSYEKKMKLFALKQLEAHEINKDLAVLYEEFFCHKEVINVDLAGHLSQVCFSYQIICENPNMVSLTVYYSELGEERTTLLEDGKAIMTIYNDKEEVFLTDKYGCKYTASVDYTIVPLFNIKECVKLIWKYSEEPMLMLHLYQHYERQPTITKESISVKKNILSLDKIQDNYRRDCYLTLIDYYYEKGDNDNLDKYLDQINVEILRDDEGVRVFQYMVSRGFYGKARRMLKNFTFNDFAINSLIKLCSALLGEKANDTKEEDLLSLCHYVFIKGRYHKKILDYLVRFYYGPSKDMLSIRKAAKTLKIESRELDKRLLSAMVFAESNLVESIEVFIDCYNDPSKDSRDRNLVKAYLTYSAYKYLVHDDLIDKKIFEIMRKELNYENNDFYLLAWLKDNSQNNDLSDREIAYIDISIDNLDKRGIVLPFFLHYKKYIDLAARLIDKTFIEHKTDPNKQVYIHYRFSENKSEEYITEAMANVFNGIYLKEFVLFHNEFVQYYISEELDGEEKLTKSIHLQYDKEMSVEEESRYNQINLMLRAIEDQDDSSLLEAMEQYVMGEYIISECFHPV